MVDRVSSVSDTAMLIATPLPRQPEGENNTSSTVSSMKVIELLSLPPEVISRITHSLSLCSYSHLSRTCKQLHRQLFHPSELILFLKTRYRLSVESGSIILFAYLANLQTKAPLLLERIFDDFFADSPFHEEERRAKLWRIQQRSALQAAHSYQLNATLSLPSTMSETPLTSQNSTTTLVDEQTLRQAKRDAIRMWGVLYALNKTPAASPSASATCALVLSGATDAIDNVKQKQKLKQKQQQQAQHAPQQQSSQSSESRQAYNISTNNAFVIQSAPSSSCLPSANLGKLDTNANGHVNNSRSLPSSPPLLGSPGQMSNRTSRFQTALPHTRQHGRHSHHQYHRQQNHNHHHPHQQQDKMNNRISPYHAATALPTRQSWQGGGGEDISAGGRSDPGQPELSPEEQYDDSAMEDTECSTMADNNCTGIYSVASERRLQGSIMALTNGASTNYGVSDVSKNAIPLDQTMACTKSKRNLIRREKEHGRVAGHADYTKDNDSSVKEKDSSAHGHTSEASEASASAQYSHDQRRSPLSFLSSCSFALPSSSSTSSTSSLQSSRIHPNTDIGNTSTLPSTFSPSSSTLSLHGQDTANHSHTITGGEFDRFSPRAIPLSSPSAWLAAQGIGADSDENENHQGSSSNDIATLPSSSSPPPRYFKRSRWSESPSLLSLPSPQLQQSSSSPPHTPITGNSSGTTMALRNIDHLWVKEKQVRVVCLGPCTPVIPLGHDSFNSHDVGFFLSSNSDTITIPSPPVASSSAATATTMTARPRKGQHAMQKSKTKIEFLTRYMDRMRLKLEALGIDDWRDKDIQRKKTYQMMIQQNDRSGESELVHFYLNRYGGSLPEVE